MVSILTSEGDAYDDDEGAVRRDHARYTPRSLPTLNLEKIPPPQELRGMELSLREMPEPLADLTARTKAELLMTLWPVLAAVTVLGLMAPVVHIFSTQFLLGVGLLLGLYFAITQLRLTTQPGWLSWLAVFQTGQTTNHPMVLSVAVAALGPVALLFLLSGGRAVANRLAIATAFALLTYYLFARFGSMLPEFYREWLYAEVRLKPETRRTHQAAYEIDLRPDLGFLGALLVVCVLVPLSFTSAAIALTVAAAFTRGDAEERREFFERILPLFYQYGRKSSGAPGVFYPTHPLSERRGRANQLAVSLVLTVTFGLYLFVPVDRLLPLAGDCREPMVQALGTLRSAPWDWIPALGHLVRTHNALFLAAPLFALLCALWLPRRLAFCVYAKPLRALRALEAELSTLDREVEATEGRRKRLEWEWFTDRLKDSSHVAINPFDGVPVHEADHLFLGVEPYHRFPLLLHEKILAKHCYMVGGSGTGKTSMGVATTVLQLMRPRRRRGLSLAESPPPPMVVLDMKGDRAFFHTMKAEVEARRWIEKGVERQQQFHFFTLEKGEASDHFNPFDAFHPAQRTIGQVCQLVLTALDLNHGAGYGRSYYTAQSRAALSLALTTLRNEGARITFRTLAEQLAKTTTKGKGKGNAEAFQLLATIAALTEYPQLDLLGDTETKHPESVIFLPRVLEERQVAYFYLPALLESITAREVGHLVLQALMSAAIARKGKKEPRQAYLIVDEFQVIASGAFRTVLEQARDARIALILANQSQSALKGHEEDLRPTVYTNTKVKMLFSVDHPTEVQDFMESSGEEVATIRSVGHSTRTSIRGVAETESLSETITLKSRITRNDVAEVSDSRFDYFCHVSHGEGYSQFKGLPFIVRGAWPFPHEVWEGRENEPWPAPRPGQVSSTTGPSALDAEIPNRAQHSQAEQEEVFARAQDILRNFASGPAKKPKEEL